MSSIVQTYVITTAIPSAEDTYNLKEDADTVIAEAVVAFSEESSLVVELDKVVGYAEIIDENNDLYDSIDSGIVSAQSKVSFIALKAFYDSDSVIGIGGMSYISPWGTGPNQVSGSSAVTNSFSVESIDSGIVGGSAIVRAKEDFISPDNSYVVAGVAEIIDRRDKYGDLFAARDRATVVGQATTSAPLEYSKMVFRGDSNSRSYLGSNAYTQFFLDQSELDDDSHTLDARYVLNTDTPDAATVVGVAINKATWDEAFVVSGAADISAHVAEGYSVFPVVESIAIVSAVDLYPTKYDALASPPPPFGQSGDGFVIGSEVIFEETTPYLINAPVSSPKFATFNYAITAVERYNYSTEMIAYSSGYASASACMSVEMATNNIAGSSSVAPLEVITISSRYSGGFTTVAGTGVEPSTPGHYVEIPAPVDGEYVYDTSMDRYYIYAAGTLVWVWTNRPIGIYGTGQYS